MGEEAFDEARLDCADGEHVLYVRGGYQRDEVHIGIGRYGEDAPYVLVEVDGKALKRALRNMVIGKART